MWNWSAVVRLAWDSLLAPTLSRRVAAFMWRSLFAATLLIGRPNVRDALCVSQSSSVSRGRTRLGRCLCDENV